MWSAEWDGAAHRFRLAGINNQNFLMRDDATGSWWQQSTGEAVLGPLRGRRLEPVAFDELTFGTWRRENPEGRVLAPVADVLAADRYAPSGWEERMARVPVVTPVLATDPFAPRTLVAGIENGSVARAWPLATIRERRVVHDEVGGVPVVLVAAEDGRSVRAFEAVASPAPAAEPLELVARRDGWGVALVDRATGSEWDFTGTAVSGPMLGARLRRLPVIVSYWFDWRTQHPQTSAWLPAPPALPPS